MKTGFDSIGERVAIRRPTREDCDEFLTLVQSSGEFHDPWVHPARTREDYYAYVRSRQTPGDDGFLLCDREHGGMVGLINVNCIVRGSFQSAYLGYWIGVKHARQGYMTEGLRLVMRYSFEGLKLHRLEANIQPQNVASIALARKCGFRKEGFSPRYLQVFGQWRDHERWALLADER